MGRPGSWAMVFPLGMYGVATYRMRLAIQLPTFEWLPKVVLGIALTVWTVTFAGLAHHLLRAARSRAASRF